MKPSTRSAGNTGKPLVSLPKWSKNHPKQEIKRQGPRHAGHRTSARFLRIRRLPFSIELHCFLRFAPRLPCGTQTRDKAPARLISGPSRAAGFVAIAIARRHVTDRRCQLHHKPFPPCRPTTPRATSTTTHHRSDSNNKQPQPNHHVSTSEEHPFSICLHRQPAIHRERASGSARQGNAPIACKLIKNHRIPFPNQMDRPPS